MKRERTAKDAKDAKAREEWQPGDIIVKDPRTGEFGKSRRAFAVYRDIDTGQATRVEPGRVHMSGRKAREDRRPVTAGLVWDLVAGDRLAVIEFLGEIGLAPAEAGKQYSIWRGQLYTGIKRLERGVAGRPWE